MSFAMYLDMEEENLIQNCIPPYYVFKVYRQYVQSTLVGTWKRLQIKDGILIDVH